MQRRQHVNAFLHKERLKGLLSKPAGVFIRASQVSSSA
jgi:hypothetical protein